MMREEMDWSGISTPALLLDRSVLRKNLGRMAEKARRLGVPLRPHVKTHKCVEVARLQTEAGARGLTVSTLAEARSFAAAGFSDLTWAFPLSPPTVAPALDLARSATLRLVVDDESTFAELERACEAAGRRVHVWLKVDCGYHRAGVDPASPAASSLALRMARSAHVFFDGLLTHAGHSYRAFDPAERRRIAAEERDIPTAFAGCLRAAGVEVPGVSIGSTPTLTLVDHLDGVTEIRPGNYAYFDLTQAALGSCRLEDIAVSVLATVVSHPPGAERAVIDAGALALSKDGGPEPPAGGAHRMGAVCPDAATTVPDPDLSLVSLSQEHGVIRPLRAGALDGRLQVGSRVRVLPNHSCLTAACFDHLVVVEGSRAIDTWKVHRQR